LAGLHTGVLQRTTHCTAHGIPHLCACVLALTEREERAQEGEERVFAEGARYLSKTVGRGAGGLRDGAV
jgi:hypothetical protein